MMNSYCRLCMAEEELQSIDSFLLNAIRCEFDVEISTEDELSQKICVQCSKFILSLIDFKKNVVNVQKVLNKMMKRNNNDCPVSSDVALNTSKSTPANEVSIDITRENEENSVDQRLQNEVEMSPENQEDINFILKIIRSIDFNEIPMSNTASKLTWNSEGTYCEVCGIWLKQQTTFTKHMKSTSHIFKCYVAKKYGKSDIVRQYRCGYTCPNCQEVKTSKKTLVQHAKEVHGVAAQRLNLKPDTLVYGSKSLTGDQKLRKINPGCTKIDSQERLLKEIDANIKTEPLGTPVELTNGRISGETNEVNPKNYTCKLCTKSFFFIESFRRHMKRRHPNTHVCLHCEYISSSSRVVSQHIRSHYNLTVNQQVCSGCFKIFNDRVQLLAHRKLVHDPMKKAFLCSLCKESFPTIAALKEHKRYVHFASENDAARSNFRCKKCNRTFLSELVLSVHQCTAKKFACLKKCGKRFEVQSKMENHMKRCTKGCTIYTCKFCKKKLSCLQTWKYHSIKCSKNAKKDAEIAPPVDAIPSKHCNINCTLCQLTFQTEDSFEKHYDKYHKSIPSGSKPEDFNTRNIVTASEVSTKGNHSPIHQKSQNERVDDKPAKNPASQITDNFVIKNNFWRCRKCRQKCLSIIELECHFSSCPGIQTEHVKCHCGAVFVDEKVLRLHEIVDHQGDKSTIAKKPVTKPSSKKKKYSTENTALESQPTPSTQKYKSQTFEQSKQHSSFTKSKSEVNVKTVVLNKEAVKNSLLVAQSADAAQQNNNKIEDITKIADTKTDSTPKRPTSKRSIQSADKLVASDSKRENSELKTNTKIFNKGVNSENTTFSEAVDSNQGGVAVLNASTVGTEKNDAKSKSLSQFNSTPESKSNKCVTETVACTRCGLVFNSKYFLEKHEFDSHQIVGSSAANTDSETKRSPYNSYFHQDKVSAKQQYTPVDRKNPNKYRNSARYNDDRYHPSNKPYRNHRSLSESVKYDDPPYRWRMSRTPDRNRDDSQKPISTESSYKVKRPNKSLLKPEYLHRNEQITVTKERTSSSYTEDKNRNQLTIISNVNHAICSVCKNPESHLFCIPCRTCYRGNQVQYMNHMKMKHASR